MTPAMNSTRRLSARAVALIGTGAVVAYALLAAVQILVWNPQAAVPGVGLDQIYADVAATGESMAAGMVIAFLAVGPLLAIALLVGVWRRPEGRASVVGVRFLALLALGWEPQPISGRTSVRAWPWPTRSSLVGVIIHRGLPRCA